MPFVAALSATAVTAGTAATATAVASATATAAATASLTTIATNALVNLAISAAMSALTPQVGQAGRPVDWILDPDAPIPFAAGRVGVAGSVVHKATFGPDLMYYGFVSVLSGAGPIKSVQSFKGDEESVTFNGAGMAVTSQWNGEMWMKSQLGAQPTTTAITLPSGLKNSAALPNWSASHRLNGKAAYMLVMGENSKRTAYPNGEVKPLVVIEGLYGWDPRLDSTYPGGSGACRLNNPATWVYLNNPILWGLKWALGLWEGPTGKGAPQVDYQVGGIGAKVEGIDVSAFVAGANVADANGWKVAAYPTTDDDKAQVLDSFLQAGGCIYAQKAGKISCIQRAAPRTSIVTISAEDTAGPLEIDTAASRINRINTLRPRFWSEANRWQMTAIEEVTATAYQTEDGGKRTRPIDFPFVPSATQAAQLAALQIANTREGIAGVIPLKPHLQRITPGDAFTITEAGFVLNGLKCLCLNTDYDPATGIHRVTFVSETDAKYPFALGQSPTAPTSPSLTPVDPTFVAPPAAGEWALTAETFTDNGASIPALVFVGDVDNATADAVIFEFRPSGVGSAWAGAGIEGPTVERKEVTGLTPGTSYEGSVSYKRGSNVSDRLVLGPVISGSLETSRGEGAAIPTGRSVAYPLTSDENSITIAAFDAYMPWGETISIPSGSVTGLDELTTYAVFWRSGTGFEVEISPAPVRMTTGSWILIDYQSTADEEGGYPEQPPPPGGYCPQEDELLLLANDEHTGPGAAIRAADVVAGQSWAWTRHESTGAWGAFLITNAERRQSALTRLVMRDGRSPCFSPKHRMGLANGRFRRLDDLCCGIALDGTGPGTVERIEAAGEGWVIRLTVDDAATFVIDGLLCHNIKRPYDPGI